VKKSLLALLFSATLGLTAAQSVTIDHKYGSTTIEGTPERVVTVGAVDPLRHANGNDTQSQQRVLLDGAHEKGIWPWAPWSRTRCWLWVSFPLA
jgi:hypothetical protein